MPITRPWTESGSTAISVKPGTPGSAVQPSPSVDAERLRTLRVRSTSPVIVEAIGRLPSSARAVAG